MEDRPLNDLAARVDAGKLRPARQLEPLTAVLISVNRYQTHSGIRVHWL